MFFASTLAGSTTAVNPSQQPTPVPPLARSLARSLPYPQPDNSLLLMFACPSPTCGMHEANGFFSKPRSVRSHFDNKNNTCAPNGPAVWRCPVSADCAKTQRLKNCGRSFSAASLVRHIMAKHGTLEEVLEGIRNKTPGSLAVSTRHPVCLLGLVSFYFLRHSPTRLS